MRNDLLTDDKMEIAEEMIREAQKRHGHGADQMEFYALRRKLVALTDGGVALALKHPVTTSRYVMIGDKQAPYEGWYQSSAKLHPVQEGLELWFSDENPELEMERRHHARMDEERAMEIRSARDAWEMARQRNANAAEQTRRDAWNKIPAASRALLRFPETAKPTAGQLAEALANEPERNSTPPEGWRA